MIYRDFGNTGLKVSAIGMGCEYVWAADEQKVKEVVGAAVEAVRSGKIEALMFPVNPLFNLLPQDSADARMKGRAVMELTDEEKSAYPTKQELYAECEKRGVTIVAMKPFVEELNQSLAWLTATAEEKDLSAINDSLVGKFHDQCMYCNHCQPCPKSIDIAQVTKLADLAEKGLTDDLRSQYAALDVAGGDCIQCGSCTKRCPFGIDAMGNMARAKTVFGR